MKRLKKLLAFVIVFMFLITMVGCKKVDEEKENTNQNVVVNGDNKEHKEEVVELSAYLFDYPQKEAFVSAVEKFEQDNPKIKVKMNETGDYDTKIGILIAGGEKIDLIAVRNPIQKLEWAQADTIIPLDELAQKNDFDFNKEFGSRVEEVMFKGKPYAMPIFGTTWFMLYNKSMFDEAKIPYPSATKAMTWSEYKELAKNLTAGEGADKKYGAFHMVWPMYWYTLGSSILGGGDKFYIPDGTASNIEDSAWKKSLQLAYDMQHVDKSVMTYTDVKVQKLRVPSFNTGKFGIFYTGDFALGLCSPDKRDFKMGVAPLPIPDEKDSDYTYTFGGYGSIAIPRTSEYQQEAFKFMMDVSRNVGELATDIVPSVVTEESKKRIASELAQKFEADGITAEEFQAVLFEAKDWNYEKITGVAAAEYESIATEEVEKYFTDMQDLDTTIKNIKERADGVIKKALEK